MNGERQYRVALRRGRGLGTARDCPLIVFHGINKSGSLALSRVLAAAYAAAGRAGEFHSHYRGDAKSYEEFRRLIETDAGRGFYVGHNLYGAFHVPRSRCALITQFRHPLPRVVSCYQWIKRRHLREVGAQVPYPSLDEWVASTRGRSYSQISQFAVPHVDRRHVALGSMSLERMAALARERIERDVACIGIAEYFEESIFLFAALCGLESVAAWRRDNRNRERVMTWDLPEASQQLIREVFRQDFLLYEWALERFFAQLRRVGIAGEIAAYKAACESQYKDRLLIRDLARETGPAAGLRAAWRRLRRVEAEVVADVVLQPASIDAEPIAEQEVE